jgi:hypothetical protein
MFDYSHYRDFAAGRIDVESEAEKKAMPKEIDFLKRLSKT